MLLYRHSFLGMLIFSSIVASSAHANRLQDILQYSLNSAPEIHEAKLILKPLVIVQNRRNRNTGRL